MKKKRINHRDKTKEPQQQFGPIFTQQQKGMSKWKAVMLARDHELL
jgi:hypothetical protein